MSSNRWSPEEKARIESALRTARELLASGWTQGCWARDADGFPVAFDDPKATCWCITGAVWKGVGGEPSGRDNPVIGLLRDELDELNEDAGIPEWNDDPDRTLSQVLSLVDSAINRLTRIEKCEHAFSSTGSAQNARNNRTQPSNQQKDLQT